MRIRISRQSLEDFFGAVGVPERRRDPQARSSSGTKAPKAPRTPQPKTPGF